MAIEERRIKTDTGITGQRLMLENRKNLSISGVSDVESFSDSIVIADTCMGRLSIKGDGLKINKLNIEAGELSVEGKINSLEYSVKKEKRGFFESIFK